MQLLFRLGACVVALALTACSRGPDIGHAKEGAHEEAPHAQASAATAKDTPAKSEAEESKEADFVTLTDAQIRAAGIETSAVRTSFAGAIDAPAVIAADPQHAATVASSVSGRVVEVRKNLGDTVSRGDILALIDSREAAQLSADLALAQRQEELANANFRREERLYSEKVSSRQEYDVSKSALAEAQTRRRLAEQQLASTGGSTQSGRLRLLAPIAGVVTARQIAVGDVVEPNAKLFEVADLKTLSVELSLSASDAARMAIGATVDVSADGRTGSARLTQLSRVLDPGTRQVRAIASLQNRQDAWRIGETVRASIALAAGPDNAQLAIPRSAVQTIEDKPSVFVRAKEGFEIKHVVLGKPVAGFVLVQSGLNGSEQIAVSNTYVLKAEHGKGAAGEDHD